ncbi:MAG: hypothetical protein WA173_08205 [Pseudomonas sp.]|uniref:DUF6988 family protein n=1 Tax=Pseudomonas sp. TaxID=306 RepID=UPI003BB60DD8
MPVDVLLSQSAKLESKLEAFFALPLAGPATRWNACRLLASLGFEHAQSLKFLVSIGRYTSAAALLRVQYESLVRAIWMLHVATDQQVEDMMAELTQDSAKKANKLPMLSEMLEAIEKKAPHAPIAHLNEFKHYSWRPLFFGPAHALSRPAEIGQQRSLSVYESRGDSCYRCNHRPQLFDAVIARLIEIGSVRTWMSSNRKSPLPEWIYWSAGE